MHLTLTITYLKCPQPETFHSSWRESKSGRWIQKSHNDRKVKNIMKVVSREQFYCTFHNLKEDLKCQQELHLSVFNSNSLSISLSPAIIWWEITQFKRSLRLFTLEKMLFSICFPRSHAIALDGGKLQEKKMKKKNFSLNRLPFFKNNI